MIEFNDFDDSDDSAQGNWIRARDLVGHWVLFIFHSTEARDGAFGTQDIATVDFSDLTDTPTPVFRNMKISDPHIVKKLQRYPNGTATVCKVEQLPPSQKGYKGAYVISQPKGTSYEAMKEKAKNLLNGQNGQTVSAVPTPAKDELEDLLG